MLETTWFLLWGLLWGIYFVLDGFDLGVGTLMPFLAKNDTERRILYNVQGPFWDGNEVWLITAGGVTFAAFPATYAVLFSSLYTALMLLLFALILRGVSYEFRAHLEGAGNKRFWDGMHVVGSFLPALLLGVAFANIFKGVPINQEGIFQGGLFTLLNPYGLAGGVLFVLMFLMHGSIWAAVKTEGDLEGRARAMAARIWPILVVWVAVFLVYTSIATRLLGNYLKNPLLFAVLLLAVLGLVMARVYLGADRLWLAWFSSALFILSTAMFGVIGMYPALLPSSLNPAWSMTIENSASSPLTLKIMLTVALIFVPIVLLYQFWVYRKFSFKVTEEELTY
jgi:cytochrome d ubiquinol oxidase subunit II